MKKLRSEKGAAALIVILILIALALAAAVFIPIIRNKANEELLSADEQFLVTAKREADALYLQNGGKPFAAVFNTEDKQFYALSKARSAVAPYGMAKEHEGRFLLVTMDEAGAFLAEWVLPNELRSHPAYTDDGLSPN